MHTASAQLTTKTMMYQGVTRTWFQHLPISYDGSRKVPLVLALHGFNDSGEQFAADSGWMPKADAAGFIVIFPNGGNPVDKVWGWHAYVFNGDAPDDAGFLLALIEEMKKNYPIDETRIYLTGFSNGGGMTSTFALLHPGVLAAIAPVSGGWRENIGTPAAPIKPDAPIPVWIWRGTAEDAEHSAAQAQMDQQQALFWAGCNEDKIAPQVYHQAPFTTTIYRGGKAEVRYTSIEGGDHAYQAGTAEKIWDGFFSIFSRQGTAIVYHKPK